jgi:hypothetical protein
MQGAIRFVLPDLLILIAGLWMIISMIAHYGVGEGLQKGGSLALDATVGYYLARISFRSLDDIRRALILFAPGVFLAGFMVMIESVSHQFIVQPLSERLFGALPAFVGGVETGDVREVRELFRLGLMRGLGPFSHSILGGLYLSSLASLYLLSGIRGWPKVIGLVASLFGIFSVSSAAILALLIGFGLSAYEWLQDRVRELNWTIMSIVGVIVLLALQVVSNSGLVGVIGRYLTLNSGTAYYRQLIWRYGSASVRSHPLFGIGLSEYDRPVWMISASVDAHWLLLAMRFGLITAVAYILAVIVTLFALSSASVRAPTADRKFYRGIAIALFVIALSMFTVTLWGGVQNWFTLLLGGCVACSQRTFKRIRVEL